MYCIYEKKGRGGGEGRQSLARKIRVGQEPRKRKEKSGVLSGRTAFCSGGRGGSASKAVNYRPYTN